MCVNTDIVLSFVYIQDIYNTKCLYNLLHFEVMQNILWFDPLPFSRRAHNQGRMTPNHIGKQASEICRYL